MKRYLMLSVLSMCLLPVANAGILRVAFKGTKAVVKTSAKVVKTTAKVAYKVAY